jgi:hypothetical protein
MINPFSVIPYQSITHLPALFLRLHIRHSLNTAIDFYAHPRGSPLWYFNFGIFRIPAGVCGDVPLIPVQTVNFSSNTRI